MFYDFFDAFRAALSALSNEPLAIASIVLLVGINASLWLLVFERVGFPTSLATLLLVPPFTFLLPLYVVLARWPSPPSRRFPIRRRTVRARSGQRVVRKPGNTNLAPGDFDHRRPLHLAADGLPRFRIALPPETLATNWPISGGLDPRYAPRTDAGPYGAYR